MSRAKNEIVVYQPDETTRLDVRLAEDTVWRTQSQMTDLFQRDRTIVTRHIDNVFDEGELDEKSNVHFLHIPCISKMGAEVIPSFLDSIRKATSESVAYPTDKSAASRSRRSEWMENR